MNSSSYLSQLSRRGFLGSTITGMAGIGLLDLLGRDLRASELGTDVSTWSPGGGKTHFPPKAKRVLQIFCPGAASHIDLWDDKPELVKRSGEPLPGEENMLSFQGKNGNLMKSPWDFVPCGESGKRITSMLPHMAKHVDDIAFIHSMTSKTNTHGPGCVLMNTGHAQEGFPSAGAWLGYALGSANDNLPTYVALPDVRGEPPNGKANWSNGFLPAKHQAIVLAAHLEIRNLRRPAEINDGEEAASREFLRLLNEQHLAQNPGDSTLAARAAAYELAARMQVSAPEVSDLSSETAETHKLYGTDHENKLLAAYAKNCLLSRRLLERGVRYVNLYCSSRASGVDGLLNWDAHRTLKSDYERHCPIFDQPTAALLSDLKRSGLLEDTLVLWTTEFGRMPTHQANTTGRDHNPDAFTVWMMGAGVKPGVSYGATDDFGRRSVTDKTNVWEFYATVLKILGYDFDKLSWYHNGFDRKITDVHGRVIDKVLA
ncbi:protein of unknown function DUF1501 [Pirellula staleyi DSM 6068]|uniref:Sulfatase n=1 Tax=Pirellula staleyi (strain ATCC 27377 / DSM 6068 / ICPB 4128) TaxID=530564 RepID=D2QYJ1_PIRSD|nr:DUF1501 domain-containing protein [Pirellula staleyi]ADB18150.1 protein of unknown function DUF1501 [Pirellula staleyi DSM 6068]